MTQQFVAKASIESPSGEKQTEATVKDAGNKPNDHYKSRLSPLRYKIRSKCLPIVRKETEILYSLQTKLRNPILDFYFAWTANLASHTFYVLMLPLPIWFGAGKLSRDLIYVLGFGIYITGFFKDYLCLPRPRSPPLHRITMSSYTAQEYGWPSSHSANATAVTLILFFELYNKRQELTQLENISYNGGLIIYYVSLIFGRLYCGMHGFFDIFTGSIIGIVVFLIRFKFGLVFDEWLLNSSRNDSIIGCLITLSMITIGYLSMIHYHSEPVDDCPCFDDSVAFIGVLLGIDICNWSKCFNNGGSIEELISIPYKQDFGIFKSLIRVLIGIVLVVVWKAVSKPIIFTILPPIYKIIGIYLPRKNYTSTAFSEKTTRQIRSQSLSNMNHESIGGEINNLIRDVIDHDKKDEVGPENDIDIYEMLDYQQSKLKNRNPPKEQTKEKEEPKVSGVFKPRFDVETIGRVLVYAGVSTAAYCGFDIVTYNLGLGA